MPLPLLALIALNSPVAELPDLVRVKGLTELGAYRMLGELTKIGGRLSGSSNAAKAVAWGAQRMKSMGFENVHLVPCMVPHWVRGAKERASFDSKPLAICALGGSVATPRGGVRAEVIEVKSLKEAADLGSKAKGKIVFFNRPFDATLTQTFRAYGGAVDQRGNGAAVAGKLGAVAVVVRSMTLAKDDLPHTGAMHYDGGSKIPAAALGPESADRLSKTLRHKPHAKLSLSMSCRTEPDVPSANVVGELRGTEFANEVIVMGGHLDSWDLAQGAHDDGTGIVQSLEALRLIRGLGLRPKRTIRVVLFMNEENGLRGGTAYGEWAKKSNDKHIAAIESDEGGFMPRAFTAPETMLESLRKYEPMLQPFGIERFAAGGGGADIGPLGAVGAKLFGLQPENQRYFDYHHAASDTIDKVNPREVEFGAMAMALLAWMLAEDGVTP